MNVCVLGLWHLGSVTAACMAQFGHRVTGLDFDAGVVDALVAGTPPIFEPGLHELVTSGVQRGTLTFTTDAATVVGLADVLWVAYDTPVDEDDQANVDFVVERVSRVFPYLRDGAVVLISSQLPVGTTRRLEEMYSRTADARGVSFAYSPENLRLGRAIDVFSHPDRIVVGVRSDSARMSLQALLRPIGATVEWMSVESAEMTKHAINAFLAVSVVFINEIASICEQVGADATEVARGLKTEARIGPKAYLSPGGAFAGGTLARDIVFLSGLGRTFDAPIPVLASVKPSNDAHRGWPRRRLLQLLGGVAGQSVAVWGLTYKPDTDTLRRSSAVELCEWLIQHGASVKAYDPMVRELPPNLSTKMTLSDSALDAVDGASALVVATAWPQFREVAPVEVVSRMRRPLVLDADRWLIGTLGQHVGVSYVSVGRVA